MVSKSMDDKNGLRINSLDIYTRKTGLIIKRSELIIGITTIKISGRGEISSSLYCDKATKKN